LSKRDRYPKRRQAAALQKGKGPSVVPEGPHTY